MPGLLDIAREFIAEAQYGWTYSKEISEYTYRSRMASDETDVLVGVENGELVSCAVVAHDREFVEQRLGYVIKFYVRAKYRGTIAGRALALACHEWFREHLVWAAFVTATANIGAAQDRQFANLFKKFGFVECGPTMMKDFAHG